MFPLQGGPWLVVATTNSGPRSKPESSPASSYLLSPITPPENEMDLGITTSINTTPALHTPERGEHESFAAYKARRAKSKAAARKVMGAGLSGGVSSREQFRDSMRANGTMGRRIRASDALMAAWASKRITKAAMRDEHGAYTCVGSAYEVDGMAPDTDREHVNSSWVHGEDMGYTARRKWLAGISAKRGY